MRNYSSRVKRTDVSWIFLLLLQFYVSSYLQQLFSSRDNVRERVVNRGTVVLRRSDNYNEDNSENTSFLDTVYIKHPVKCACERCTYTCGIHSEISSSYVHMRIC